jgi:hypothetical protein
MNAASATVVVSNLPPKNVVYSYDEIMLQNGIHDGTEFGESLFNYSNLGGNFNDYPNVQFDEFGGQTVLKLKASSEIFPFSGSYLCARKDMGSLITASISSQFISSVLIRSGISAKLQCRTSRDEISWTEWQDFTPTQSTFQYVDFRVLLSTSDPSKTPEVSTLREVIDVPDVDKYGTSVIAVGGTDIFYGYTYWQIPVVAPTAIGQDRRAELINVDIDHCTVRVLDAAGTDIGGRVNWLAKGF